MEKISVACIAVINNKVLIAKRNPTGQMGSRWEFPGGKTDEGETPVQAVVREMQEEFGITVKIGSKITTDTFEHNGTKRTLEAYEMTVPHDGMEKQFILSEHTEYKWVSFAEIPELNFVDSDLKIYPAVKKYFEGKED